MSFVKQRSDYFKSIAAANKLVAHGVEVDGEVRNSFHRMNDEAELQAACINWAHFPCVVHIGMVGRYSSAQAGLPKRKVTNMLTFLQKASPTNMDEIELAKDTAFEVMEDFISWIWAHFYNKGQCSPFSNIDLSRFSFSEDQFGENLFGWGLTFEDERFSDVTTFNPAKWTQTPF